MSEPDRTGPDGGDPAEDDDPRPDSAPAGPRGQTVGQRNRATEQAAGGGPVETRDGPEPGDVYVPV
jgi:hypothetical protein